MHISDVSHHNLRIFLNIFFFVEREKFIFFIMKISFSKPSVWNWIIQNWLFFLQKMRAFMRFLPTFQCSKVPSILYIITKWEKWEAQIRRNSLNEDILVVDTYGLESQYLLSSLKENFYIHINLYVRRIEFWLWKKYIPQSKSNNKYTNKFNQVITSHMSTIAANSKVKRVANLGIN